MPSLNKTNIFRKAIEVETPKREKDQNPKSPTLNLSNKIKKPHNNKCILKTKKTLSPTTNTVQAPSTNTAPKVIFTSSENPQSGALKKRPKLKLVSNTISASTQKNTLNTPELGSISFGPSISKLSSSASKIAAILKRLALTSTDKTHLNARLNPPLDCVFYAWPQHIELAHAEIETNQFKTFNENFFMLLEAFWLDLKQTLFFLRSINTEEELQHRAALMKYAFLLWLFEQPNLDGEAVYPVKDIQGQNTLTLWMLIVKLHSESGNTAIQQLIQKQLVTKMGKEILNSDGSLNLEKLKQAQKTHAEKNKHNELTTKINNPGK